MKSKFNFALAIGMLALTSSQALAGDIVQWVDETKGPILMTSTMPLIFSGLMMSESARIKDITHKNQTFQEVAKEDEAAEREFQAEKAKLESMINSSHGFNPAKRATAAQIENQRRILKTAEDKFWDLRSKRSRLYDDGYVAFLANVGEGKTLKDGLKKAKIYSRIGKAGMILTVPVNTAIFGIADIMRSKNMTKAQTSEAGSNASPSTTPAIAKNQSAH